MTTLELSLISGEERKDLICFETLADQFRSTVSRVPEKIALIFEGESFTYLQLDFWSDEVASRLQEKGVGRGSFVGVWLKRGATLHATILGIVKSGAAYVPLDREMPSERVLTVLTEVGATHCFSDDPISFSGEILRSISFADLSGLRKREKSLVNLAPSGPQPDDIAYVLYTSGSTGKPKGIPIAHCQIAHFVRSENSVLAVCELDRVYQGFSVSFDMWCEETWITYLVGATLFVIDEWRGKAVDELSSLLEQERITVLHAVPSLLGVMRVPIRTLRLINAGGEACSESVFERWANEKIAFYNTYGPTETTVSASIQRLEKGKMISIGKPLPNYGMAIVDEQMRVVAKGERGELVITGLGVSKGYFARPDLTSMRFLPKPLGWDGLPGVSLYRTGDEARMNEGGEIEFLGRIDDQIKIRGYRVELGEIENALSACEGVRASCVVVIPSISGSNRILGFLIIDEGRDHDGSRYRADLMRRLPSYMVPERVIILDSFPRLPSGKIDRKRLTAQYLSADEPQKKEDFCPIDGSGEDRLLWGLHQIFRDQEIDLAKDFFDDYGGHSLLAAQLVSILRGKAKMDDLSIKDLYLHRPLSALLEKISKHSEPKAIREEFKAIDLFRYYFCAIGQTFSLIGIYGLYAMQIFCPYLVYYFVLQETESHLSSLSAAMMMFCLMSPLLLLINGLLSRLFLQGIEPGDYPLWGLTYFRWWIVQTLHRTAVLEQMNGTPLYSLYLRYLGMRIGKNVYIDSIRSGMPHLIWIESNAEIGSDVVLDNVWVEGGVLKVRSLHIGRDAVVGSRCILGGGSVIEEGAELRDLGCLSVGKRIPTNQIWEGSPARPLLTDLGVVQKAKRKMRLKVTSFRQFLFSGIYLMLLALFPLFLILPMTPTLITITYLDDKSQDYDFTYLILSPFFALSYVILFLAQATFFIRYFERSIKPGVYPLYSSVYLKKWFCDHIWRLSLFVLHPIYATIYIAPVLRMLGAQIGRNAEISTASNITPHLLKVGDDSFIADSVNLGEAEVVEGRLILEKTEIGEGTFIGNGALIPQGRTIPSGLLIGVLSVIPSLKDLHHPLIKNWFGIPAIPMPNRQASAAFDPMRTFRPSFRLCIARGIVELLRLIFPMTVVIGLSTLFVAYAHDMIHEEKASEMLIQIPFYYLGMIGIPAFVITVILKWVLVGRYQTSEHPMWSWAVWSSEAVTVIYEYLAVPYFLGFLQGTLWLPLALRCLGVHVGKRVWMNTTDVTEFDLVTLKSESALNVESGPQTHLFEDRVMKMGTVEIGERASIGSRSVILYGSKIGDETIVEPQSLVMKGEHLAPCTRWAGSPISPV